MPRLGRKQHQVHRAGLAPPFCSLHADFGFGSMRQRAERFVTSFEDTYSLRRVCILGDDVRVLRCYPGQWQVHYVTATNKSLLLAADETRPTYERLLELLKAVPGSR